MKYLPIICTVALFTVILWFDIPRLLGAHPWWSAKVVLIGAPIGIVVGLIWKGGSEYRRLFVFGLFVFFSFLAAYFGKNAFANSYGENTIAGRFWYVGWIASMAALAAFALTVFRRLVR